MSAKSEAPRTGRERLVWLTAVLSGTSIASSDETELQARVKRLLKAAGIKFREQHQLTRSSRLDFFCDGVAIELKVKGSPAELLHQLDRYAEHDDVQALLVVTTKASHTGLPEELRGKPVGCVWMGSL